MSLVDDIEMLVKRGVLKIREVNYSDTNVRVGEQSYKHFLIINASNEVDAVILYGFFQTVVRNAADGTRVSLNWGEARRIKNLAKAEHNFSLSDKYRDLVEDSNDNILKKRVE